MFFTSTKLKSGKTCVALMLLLLAFFVSRAQLVANNRLEIPVQSDYESFYILPLDSSGLALYRTYVAPKENLIELQRLDTAFHQVWKGFLPFSKQYNFVTIRAYGNRIFIFFRPADTKKNNFNITVVNIQDGTYRSFVIENLIRFDPSEYVVGKAGLLIAGYFNLRPLALFYSFDTQKAHMLSGFLNEPGEITQIKTYPDGNTDIVISAKNNTRRKCLWIRRFDAAGEMIKTIVLEPGEKKNLIFGRAAKDVNDRQVVAGVYGQFSLFARGIFVAEINPDGAYVIHYYNFSELKNFFHYLRPKKEMRIQNRIERRKVKGKKTKFNYRVLVDEVLPYKDQFILVAEAYIPHYASTPSGYSYIDGYQYTHAFTIGFDRNAKVQWDNSIDMNDLKSGRIRPFVKLMRGQDDVELLYINSNRLWSKVIRGNEVVRDKTPEVLSPAAIPALNLRNGQNSQLEYWYSNHLIAYGTQNIRTPDNAIRKVFFINKLTGY